MSFVRTHAAPLVVDVSRVECGKNFKVNAKVLLTVLAVDLLQLVLDRSEINLQSGVIAAALSESVFSIQAVGICLTVVVVISRGKIVQGIQQLDRN